MKIYNVFALSAIVSYYYCNYNFGMFIIIVHAEHIKSVLQTLLVSLSLFLSITCRHAMFHAVHLAEGSDLKLLAQSPHTMSHKRTDDLRLWEP